MHWTVIGGTIVVLALAGAPAASPLPTIGALDPQPAVERPPSAQSYRPLLPLPGRDDLSGPPAATLWLATEKKRRRSTESSEEEYHRPRRPGMSPLLQGLIYQQMQRRRQPKVYEPPDYVAPADWLDDDLKPATVPDTVGQAFDQAERGRENQAQRQPSGPARMVLDRSRIPPVRGASLGGLGNVLAMVLGDGSAPLWRLDVGRETLRLRQPDGAIRSLALSPDGGLVATGGSDGAARFWDAVTGAQTRVIRTDGGAIGATAFSPSGRTLIVGSADGTVRLYDRATGEENRRFAAHQGAVNQIAVDGDGRRMATAGADGQVRLWAIGPGPLAAEAKVQPLGLMGGATQAPGMAVAFSPDRRFMAIGAADGGITLFDVAAGKPVHRFTAHQGAITAVAFSPNGRELVSGGQDSMINLYSIEDRSLVRRFEGHQDAVTAVSFEPSGQVLQSSSLDGTSRIWRRATGKEAAQLVSTDDGWLITDPAGRYDGSDKALAAATWQAGQRRYRLEQFAETHHQPDLLALITAGEDDAAPAAPLAEGVAAPPLVEIFWDQARHQDGAEEVLELKIAVENQGGGIDEIRFYQNGKLVGGSGAARAVPAEEKNADLVLRDYRVELVSGENQFRVVALSTGRVESEPAEITVRFDGPKRKSTLHVVAVGINEYKNPEYRLNYGVPDAKAILDFFDNGKNGLFKSVETERLLDKKATKRRIVRELESLSDAEPEDTVVLYMAGHGDTLDGEWYFWPYDLVRPEREKERRDKGLSRTELLDLVAGIGAQKVLMLIDSCKSGAALNTRGVAADRKALSQLARAAGIHLVAAAGQEQLATELAELGHGVFTYAVLEGLQGRADAAPGNGIVSIFELMDYIDERIPQISRQYRAKAQYPVVDLSGQNFPIAVVR